MSKIIKTNLSRGTKLSVQHFNDNKSAIEDVIHGNVGVENLVLNKGKFSLTFNFPRLNADQFAYTSEAVVGEPNYDEDSSGLFVPFLLPPLQQDFDSTVGTYPMPFLRSMSFSIDTYMDNFSVNSETASLTTPLGATENNASVYSANIQIREKDQWYRYGSSASKRADNIAPRTIIKQRISGLSFNSTEARFNPFFINGIDQLLNPLKTYLMKIDFPDIYDVNDTSKRYVPTSLTVKLDFEIGVDTKDDLSTNENLQNYPTNNVTGTNFITLDTAISSSMITARAGTSGSARIQRNFELLDEKYADGFPSGMDLRSSPPLTGTLEKDASYFCLAVPMFSGFFDVRSSDLNTIGLPYGDQGEFGGDPGVFATKYWTNSLYDRRLIPISQPFTIHHVFAVHDYGSRAINAAINSNRGIRGSGRQPESPEFVREIGVGIASGIRSESKKYEQVAYLQTSGSTKFNYLVDQVNDGLIPQFYTLTNINTTGGYQADQEIYQVPLVPNIAGGFGQRSYWDQGAPYFIGKSDLNTQDRTEVGIIGGGTRTPLTNGEELYLDVRWQMYDNSVYGLSWVENAGAEDDNHQINDTFIGSSGCWVYIVGQMATL